MPKMTRLKIKTQELFVFQASVVAGETKGKGRNWAK